MVAVLGSSLAVIPGASAQAVSGTCATSLTPSGVSGAQVVQSAYGQWKAKYVTSQGAGGDLRVQRSANDNYDTVSEGIAYGMLFAVYNNDKPTFDGLWAYQQKHLNHNGIMNWRIAANGSTTGWNGATDAEEDMAAALIAADTAWGGYRTQATKLIGLIKQHEVENGSLIIKPGDVWGGSGQMNPSYIAPSYYDAFASYTGDKTWNSVKAANYRVLQAIHANTDARQTGLFPDWSNSEGYPTSGMGYSYSYDASRAPLRIALDSAWSCNQTASALLAPFNATFESKNLSTLASSYRLNGSADGNGDALPLLAAAAAGAVTSSNDAYRTRVWQALTTAPSTSYYPDSMRLFGLMVASGVMTNPLTLTPGTTTPPPASTPTSYSVQATNSTATVGQSSTISAGVSATNTTSALLVDLELYNAQGTRVAQRFVEDQTLGATPSNYTINFTPSVAGTYTLKVGVFTNGWAENLLWNGSAATIQASTQTTTPSPTPTPPTTPPSSSANLSIWWPSGGQSVSGVQPFKAVVDGRNVSDYSMSWQVDGGVQNAMTTSNDGAPHKLSVVDLSNWRWSSTGKYTITFTAKNAAGSTIAQKSVVITVTQ